MKKTYLIYLFLVLVCSYRSSMGEVLPTSSLDIQVSGHGDTVVVFEAGFGTPREVWSDTIKLLPEDTFTLVCYSRPGIGQSKAPVKLQTINEQVEQLGAVISLHNGGKQVLLVGHSLGGLLVSEFARQYPERVSGVVLIEPSTLQQRHFFNRLDAARVTSDDNWLKTVMPPPLVGRYELLISEMEATNIPLEPMPADLPLVVMTATLPHKNPAVLEETESGRKVWLALHAILIENTQTGIHYRIPNSDHNLHLSHPEIVADSVEQLARSLTL